MYGRRHILTCAIAFSILAPSGAGAVKASKVAKEEITTGAVPVLWRNPTDISSRDLFYGPGGKEHEPRGTFTFLEEDLKGINPKIVVRDEDGVRWTVKLGAEARPEVAATRLVWAAGYFANEDYFLRDLRVRNIPPRLRRGQKLVAPDGSLHDVRLKRHLPGERKIGDWSWRHNRFAGTRELNGLRAMMALLNNWDLTKDNTAIYVQRDSRETGAGEAIYMVSDVGSTFGSARLTWPLEKARGNLREYSRAKFPARMTADYVDFSTPGLDHLFLLPNPLDYFHRVQERWIGRHIPRADVRWIGQALAQLSPKQIRDAFRAAEYSPENVEGFATVVENRIAVLEGL